MGGRIEGIGTFENTDGSIVSSLELAHRAIRECFCNSRYEKDKIDILINASPYRDNYFVEPAFAAFVQNNSGINHDIATALEPRTFASDLLNGAMGFFNACQVLSSMVTSGKIKTGMVVSCDVMDYPINKSGAPPGFCSTGAAMILDNGEDDGAGFGTFFHKKFSDYRNAYQCYGFSENGWFSVVFNKKPEIEKLYIEAISEAVTEFLNQVGMGLNDFDVVFAPQISPQFISELVKALEGDKQKFIDVAREDGDLFNASMPMSIKHTIERCLVSPGQTGLIINVASGIQVGCAIYKF